MKRLFALIGILAVGMVAGWFMHQAAPDARQVVADTTRVTVVDTIPYYLPVPKDSVVTRYVTRTLAIPAPEAQDTVADTAADSVAVVVPIEQKVYEDSLFKACVSGFEARLDSIIVFPRTEIVTVTRAAEPHGTGRLKRWGLGLQVGCGWNGKVQPYVGVGVSYNILAW